MDWRERHTLRTEDALPDCGRFRAPALPSGYRFQTWPHPSQKWPAAAQKARDLSSQDVSSVAIRPAAPKGWRYRDTTVSVPPTLVARRAPPETPVPPLLALQAQVIRGKPPAGSERSATRRTGRCARSLQRSLAPRAPGDGLWRPGLAHSREGHWR